MQVILSVTVMLVDLSLAIKQVTVSVANIVSSFCSEYMGDNFYCNYAGGSLCFNMQVVFSAVHYAHDCFCCSYAGDCLCYSYVGDSLKYITTFYSYLLPTLTFHKIDQKTFKDFISCLHFTTFCEYSFNIKIRRW